jgi:hypothetical protein
MKLVRENINFERGLSSKTALNVGKDRKIMKGDNFKVWNFYGSMYDIVTAQSDQYIADQDEIQVDIILPNGKDWYAVKDEKGWSLGNKNKLVKENLVNF